MNRIFCCVAAIFMVFTLASCSNSETGEKPGPTNAAGEEPVGTAAPSGTQGPGPETAAVEEPAVQETAVPLTADGLRAQIEQFEREGNYMAAYEAALELTELDPSDAEAYIAAAWALSELSKANYAEIDRLFAVAAEKTDDLRALSAWAEQNQPEVSIAIPFAPDYSSADNINVEGISTGNMTNAAKYRDNWWQGGLLTWQGDWVYMARPDEDFAIYKVRSDGSDFQRLGEAFGSSLNVVGDWIFYLNIQDSRPYKMRTDGSMNTEICDEECSFLSVSGDFMYYGGDRLYRIRTYGSEKVALTEGLTIFSCVSGDWVYYAVIIVKMPLILPLINEHRNRKLL